MRILSQYILQEYLGNYFLGLFIFTFVLLLDQLFELVDLVLNKGVGFWTMMQLLGLLLPSSLTLTLPTATLLAALLTFGRLSENNEITAARASGLAAWSYVRMPLAVALLTALFLVPFNTTWAPRAHSYFRQLYVQVLNRNPLVRIEEKTFVEIGDYRLFVQMKDKKSKQLRGVTIYKIPVEGPPLRIFAETGRAAVDPVQGVVFTLADGRIEQIDPDHPDQWFQTKFNTYQISIPLVGTTGTSERAIEEMDNRELRAAIARLRTKNLKAPVFSCQLHLRWALAVTPLLFVIMGIPLAIRMHRGGRSIGFGVSLLVLVGYYVLLMGGMGLGQKGQWPPFLAVWLGNFVLMAVASGLSLRFLRQ